MCSLRKFIHRKSFKERRCGCSALYTIFLGRDFNWRSRAARVDGGASNRDCQYSIPIAIEDEKRQQKR